jgi:hypothetical protein
MTIEPFRTPSELAIAPQDAAISRLATWAESASAAHRVAESLAQSAFVPAQFRGKPIELTAAILAGIEVGLSPMAAMRSFDIISGVAAPRAITLRAIVQSFGHEMVLVESTATRCDEWQGVTWTMDRARDLGLVAKDNWKKQPAAMLVARATSELARLIASDAILGIGYSSEEIADGGSYEAQVAADVTTPATSSGTRKMSRQTVAAPTAEPEPETESVAEESPYLNTSSGLAKRMFAAMNENGITDRAERLAYVSAVLGRDVFSSSDMTDADAEQVIAALELGKQGISIVVDTSTGEIDPTIDESWGQA